MIILSAVSLKDKVIEMTDVINIANGAELRDPEGIKDLLSSFYGVKKEDINLIEHSAFNSTFVFDWLYRKEGECFCTRELILFWKEMK